MSGSHKMANVLGDDGIHFTLNQRVTRMWGKLVANHHQPPGKAKIINSTCQRAVARPQQVNAANTGKLAQHFPHHLTQQIRRSMTFQRWQNLNQRKITPHNIVKAKTPFNRFAQQHGLCDHRYFLRPLPKKTTH